MARHRTAGRARLDRVGYRRGACAPIRQIRKLRLLADVLPAMLDQMAKGDMPNEQQLRTIERHFLVPIDEYAVGRFGFVIDETRHAAYLGSVQFRQLAGEAGVMSTSEHQPTQLARMEVARRQTQHRLESRSKRRPFRSQAS